MSTATPSRRASQASTRTPLSSRRPVSNRTVTAGAGKAPPGALGGITGTRVGKAEPELSLLAKLRMENEIPRAPLSEDTSFKVEGTGGNPVVAKAAKTQDLIRQRAEISEKIRRRNQEQLEKAKKAGEEKRRKAEERRDLVKRQLEDEARKRAGGALPSSSDVRRAEVAADPVVQLRREMNQEYSTENENAGPRRRVAPLPPSRRPAAVRGDIPGVRSAAVGQSMDEEMQMAIMLSRMEAMNNAAEDDELSQVIALSRAEAGLDPFESEVGAAGIGAPPDEASDMTYESLLELEDVEVGVPAAVFAAIESKVYIPDDYKEAESCTVCMCEYEGGDDMKVLRCKHEFHTECLEEWSKRKNVCPICKASLS